MTFKDAFWNAMSDEVDARKSREASVPKGMRLATLAETGVHLKRDDSARGQKLAYKFTDTPEGHAAWEKQAQATQESIAREGGIIIALVSAGKKIGTPEHEEAMNAWRAGKLELPSLAEALGMKPTSNQQTTPRAPVERRETNQQLEDRLARQRRERTESVRLERVTKIER